jgi:predicted TIM-barrel fold metal-dependent hydrolase
MACVREVNLARVERLQEQANAIVAEIAATVRDDPSLLEGRRERLQKLYDELRLALQGQRDDVHERLKQLRRVKRAVGTYRAGSR